MSGPERTAYFEKYITKLKKEDEEAQKKAASEKEQLEENQEREEGKIDSEDVKDSKKTKTLIPKTTNDLASGSQSNFYFYNPSTVAYGKLEFVKKWGKITLQDNWRVSSLLKKDNEKGDKEDSETQESDTKKDGKGTDNVEDRYSTDFYLKQIPDSQTVIDSLSKERNFANYQLGLIYKEKFKEYKLASNKFEKLLGDQPEERLVLPAMYHLYKIYEILDKQKADTIKARIISLYPDSRYAQILLNPSSETDKSSDSPNGAYANIYKQYENGEYKAVLTATENAINRYTGEDIIPKFELLKANIVGKLNGLEEFETALNYVALNYPNSEEGKRAEKIISIDLPKLEALELSRAPSKNWKILYNTKNFEDAGTKVLREKLKKFIADRSLNKLSVSLDIYTMTDNFVVVHGMNSEDLALSISAVLKDYKDYKVQEKPIVISAENYTIVQIKKNLDEFLAGNLPETAPQPNWDGTIERASEPSQPKPNANNNQQTPPSKDGLKNKKGEDQGPEGLDPDVPASPQMNKSDKKG